MGTWAKTLRILVVVLALVALAAGAAPASASQGGETQCIGAPASMVVQGDLVVPAGQSCELFRTIVTGDVRIEAGAELRTDRAQINGNVQAGEMANAIFTDTHVIGAVEARGSLNLNTSGGTLGGDVRAQDTYHLLLDRTTFGGDLEVTGGMVSPSLGGFELWVKGSIRTQDTARSNFFASRVDGGVTVERAQTAAVFCGNSVAGDATFVDNATRVTLGGTFSCDGNEVRGTLAVHQNTGAITIGWNIVRGDLACTGNDPAPVGGENQVEGAKLGQCSGL